MPPPVEYEPDNVEGNAIVPVTVPETLDTPVTVRVNAPVLSVAPVPMVMLLMVMFAASVG